MRRRYPGTPAGLDIQAEVRETSLGNQRRLDESFYGPQLEELTA